MFPSSVVVKLDKAKKLENEERLSQGKAGEHLPLWPQAAVSDNPRLRQQERNFRR